MIDMASVYAERYKQNPQALQAAVMGQSPDPKLDPYTALNALRLVKESNMMAMSGKAQQPTSAPSIVAETMAPPTPQQGLGAMMPMGAPAARLPPQPQMAQAPQGPMQMASGGLAGMYTPEEDYAVGGIVAFSGKNGSLTSAEVAAENEYQGRTDTEGFSDGQGRPIDAQGNLLEDTEAGTGTVTDRYNKFLLDKLNSMDKDSARVTSPEEQETLFNKFLRRETNLVGPDIYADEIKQGAQDETDRGKRRNTGEAMALLTAAGKVLKGHNLATGAGEALPAYAQQMNEVDRADQAARDANRKMQFALKDAQRKERTGNIRSATASMENYRKFQQDENKAIFERDKAVADLAAKGITGNRPLRGAGAGSGPKVAEQLAKAEYDNLMATSKPKPGESDGAFEARIRAQALRTTQAQLAQKQTYSISDIPPGGPKDVNTKAALTTKQNANVTKYIAIWEGGAEARKAKIEGNYDAVRDAKLKALREEARKGVDTEDDGDKTALGTSSNPIRIK